MPEAIATTKRKFYRALDSLSNVPATRPTERAAKRIRRSISTGSAASRTTVPATEVQAGSTTPKQLPNFSPWSHETFLARLKTFSSVSLWHPKPEAIDEVEWAKRGWVCVDVNTVACRKGCEKRVVVSLDVEKRPSVDEEANGAAGEDDAEADEDEDDGGLEEALTKRYQSLIVDGHATTCLWHKAGCKEDIYHLQVVRPTVWQPELKRRYRSLQTIEDATRNIRVKALSQGASAPEKLLADLPPHFLDDGTGNTHESQRSLEIALHGWRGSKDSGNDLLHCDACFQRIGLWMYQPGYRSARTLSEDNNDEAGDESITIDLLEMHRDHCPWRNPATQRASGSLSGLNGSQILQRVLTTYAREQRRKSDEQQKSVQQLEAEDLAEEEADAPVSPAPSREEVDRQDRERESRLRRLKSIFSIKRRPTIKPAVGTAKTR